MLKTISRYLFGMIVILAVVILQSYPNLPSTVLEWVFLLVLGPPLWFLGEWFFGKVFSPERGRRMSDKRFSVKRISFALIIVLPLFLAIYILSYLFRGM
jgi:hypothetical protein